MTDNSEGVSKQLSHPLVSRTEYETLAEYILALMHLKAYEEVARYVGSLSVLDLGCNDGYGTALLADRVASIVGLDVSPAAVEAAQTRLSCTGVRVELYDGVRSPFSESSFDAVVSHQVIEHIADYDSYFEEIERVTRPGGLVVFTTPNAAIRLLPGQSPWNPFHVREFRADELREFLKARFPRVEVRGLFGIGQAHEIEIERCARARDSAVQQQVGGVAFIRRKVGPAFHSLSRACTALLSAGSKSGTGLSTADLGRFSTDDFEYRSSRLDEALDLMAVCRIAEA